MVCSLPSRYGTGSRVSNIGRVGSGHVSDTIAKIIKINKLGKLGTHDFELFANGSRVSIAIIRLCLCDSVCDSVCTIKPKRLKLKSPNLAQR